MIVQLLGKLECHLCEEAKDALLAARERVPFTLQEIDVRGDAALWERYRYDVPVVMVDGRELCRHRVDADALERLVALGRS